MPTLPDELWQLIFYLATDNPARRQWECGDDPLEIKPFELFREEAEIQLSEVAFRMKASVCLVCRKWRGLSSKFLFEDIRIRQGSFALAGKLEKPVSPLSDVTFGTYVRRIIIPVIDSGVWQHTLEVNAKRILMACPNTLILCRRCQEKYKRRFPRRRNSIKGAIDDIQLPLLRRVDWNNSPVYFYGSERARGAPRFIWSTPRLGILSLSDYVLNSNVFPSRAFPWDLDEEANAKNSTSLTSIHTLRLDCRKNHNAFEEIWGTRLTSIRCLVLHQPQGDILRTSSFSKIAQQLQVVEVAFLRQPYRRAARLPMWSDVFSACPNIISFRLHIRTLPFYQTPQRCLSGSLEELILLMQVADVEADLLEAQKSRIFEAISQIIKDRAIFPSLARIELHGAGWKSLYGESIVGLQRAAEENQVALSLQSTDL